MVPTSLLFETNIKTKTYGNTTILSKLSNDSHIVFYLYTLLYEDVKSHELYLATSNFLQQKSDVISTINNKQLVRREFKLHYHNIRALDKQITQLCYHNDIENTFYPYSFEIYNRRVPFYRLNVIPYYTLYENGLVYLDKISYFMDSTKKRCILNFISNMTVINEKKILKINKLIKKKKLEYDDVCQEPSKEYNSDYRNNIIFQFFFMKHKLLYKINHVRLLDGRATKAKTYVNYLNNILDLLIENTDLKAFWLTFDKLIKEICHHEIQTTGKCFSFDCKNLEPFIREIGYICSTTTLLNDMNAVENMLKYMFKVNEVIEYMYE